MRHYEIVILVHPDQTPQLEGMVSRYRSTIEKGGGLVHRSEDWGRRQLAFTINKVRKAHYYLMNIECNQAVLDELNNSFRYNDAILRHLVLVKDKAYTDRSPMAADAERKAKYKNDSDRKSKPATSAVTPATADNTKTEVAADAAVASKSEIQE